MTAIAFDLTPGTAKGAPIPLTWQNDLIVTDQTGNYEVRINTRALAEMRTEARRGHRIRGTLVETGGMLLGSFDEATQTVYLDTATGPSPDSTCRPRILITASTAPKRS